MPIVPHTDEPAIFRLAPQSKGLFVLSALIFPIPFVMGAIALGYQQYVLLAAAGFMLMIWAFVWLWMRPSRFELRPEGLWIRWPLRKRFIPLADIERAEGLTCPAFAQRYGPGIRMGAGGLFGGFGYYKTQKTCFCFYVSRLDGWIIVHRHGKRPILLTPERPEAFVERLASQIS